TGMNDSVFAHFAAVSVSEKSIRGVAGGVRTAGDGGSLTSFWSVVSVMESTFGETGREALGKIGRKRTCERTTFRLTPNGVRKMGVILETRNDVPVQMGRDVAQARQVELMRRHEC